MEKVTWNNLSFYLKVAVVGGWIGLLTFVIDFTIGFISGLNG